MRTKLLSARWIRLTLTLSPYAILRESTVYLNIKYSLSGILKYYFYYISTTDCHYSSLL